MTEWTEWKIPRKHRGRPGRGATPNAPHFPTEMRSGISEECRIIFTHQSITQPLKPPSAPASVEPFSFSRLVAPVAPAKAEEKAGMRADDRTLCALEFPMPRSSRGDEALKSPPRNFPTARLTPPPQAHIPRLRSRIFLSAFFASLKKQRFFAVFGGIHPGLARCTGASHRV